MKLFAVSNRSFKWYLLLGVVMSLQFLVGCDDPEKLSKEGKNEEAAKIYMERAIEAENRLKDDSRSANSRKEDGKEAIENYFKAAECQKKMGNSKKAQEIYTHLVALSEIKIKEWSGPEKGWQEPTLASQISTTYIESAKKEIPQTPTSDSGSTANSVTNGKAQEF